VENGWLRLSDRRLDRWRSTALRPYHPYLQADAEQLTPGKPELAGIELLPFDHVCRASPSERVGGRRARLPPDRPARHVRDLALPDRIAGPVVESMIANDLRHSIALRPAGDYMIALGTAFNESGVPTVSSIVAPNYMVSWADNGHLDKFLPARAALEVRWAADLMRRALPLLQP
jgi:hypothetical protein